ncbi:recombinase family protein [Mycolicibacterium hodleri]|uniref:recombinase family protein n=1 Tax=Mycolicibacterium hodleri TaxID=49897 RepID=UPI0021F28ECE|nr:recombinase family protein [Mycolicibacterium hodleri]
MTLPPLRTVLYLRVSLDRTGEQLAVERQRKDAERIASQRGWHIVDTYTDNSVSAAGKKARPAFTKMLDAIKRGQVQAVVAWSLDRLARNARDRLALVEACRDHGVIIALVQGSDMDPTTASGRLVIGVLGEVAEMEIGLKSERQTAAAVQRSNLGRPPLGVRLTGYTPGGETIAEEAELVRRIFTLFHAGESLRSLTRLLNEEGVTTRKGRPWNSSSIRGILTNPRYAGRAIYQGEATGKRGNWEPFVSGDVFDLIQARLADPRRTTNRVGTDRKHLGSGLYRCAVCEMPTSSWSQGRYRCKEKHVNRSQSQVDPYVLDVVAERLRQSDIADLLAPARADLAPLLEVAGRLSARLEQIESDYDAGLINGVRYASANDRIRAELAAVQQEMADADSGSALGLLLGSKDPASEFLNAGLMTQRAIVDALATVRLHPGTRYSRVFDPDSVQVDWLTD